MASSTVASQQGTCGPTVVQSVLAQASVTLPEQNPGSAVGFDVGVSVGLAVGAEVAGLAVVLAEAVAAAVVVELITQRNLTSQSLQPAGLSL